MPTPNLLILYVADPAASAAFYRRVTGAEPVAASANFVAVPLPGGFTLGLWRLAKVAPPPGEAGARSEIAIMVESPVAIEALLREWTAAGIPIEQDLTVMDFGPTFVAADPDGHRLRVCLFDE